MRIRHVGMAVLVCAGVARAQPVTALDRARSLAAQGDWAGAVEAMQGHLDEIRYDGGAWQDFGYGLMVAGHLAEAIPALERSLESARMPAVAAYNLACCHARLGQREEAERWLARSFELGFRDFRTLESDTDIESIRDTATYRAFMGPDLPADATRDERWRFDIDRLMVRIEQVHYSPYAKVSREALHGAAEDLKRRVPELSDQRVLIGIQRLMAMLGDGHSELWFVGGTPEFGVLPIGLYLFDDGLFVYGAREAGISLLGGRVTRIGSLPVDEALARIEPICSADNSMGVRSIAPFYLCLPDVLEDIGAIPASGPAEIEVVTPDGEVRRETLDPEARGAIGHPSRPAPGVTLANAKATVPTPLYLTRGGERQWSVFLADLNAVYFKFNAVQNPPGSTLAESFQTVFDLIESSGSDTLIIDVRDNGGGNNTLLQPLIHGLIRRPELTRRGHLFVITGRRTFSAAGNCISRLEREVDPIFVGEPAGTRTNFVGETSFVTLPASGLTPSISSLYWQDGLPWDHRPWIAPDVVAEMTFEDFAANRDPAMEAIATVIAERGG